MFLINSYICNVFSKLASTYNSSVMFSELKFENINLSVNKILLKIYTYSAVILLKIYAFYY